MRLQLDQQQRMHMIEMDQNCNQIATMMEALKLLTCDMTIDMDQTQILGSESMNKEADSERNTNRQLQNNPASNVAENTKSQ